MVVVRGRGWGWEMLILGVFFLSLNKLNKMFKKQFVECIHE